MSDWEADAEETAQKVESLLRRGGSQQLKKTDLSEKELAPSSQPKDVLVARKGLLDEGGNDADYCDDGKNGDPMEERRRKEAIEERHNLLLAGDLLPKSADPAILAAAALQVKKKTKTLPVVAAPQVSSEDAKLSSLSFNTISECQSAVQLLGARIMESQAKSVALLELLKGLLEVCAPRMDEKDLQTISNRAGAIKLALQKEKRLSAQSGRKAYDKGKDQIRNYKDELAMQFGGDDDDDEDSENEDFM